MKHVGDLATTVAAELNEAWISDVMADRVTVDDDREVVTGGTRSLMEKIRFRWRDSDQAILTQIRASAEAAFVDLFDDMLFIIDEVYAAARVAKLRNGVAVKDPKGRVVWETDERGRPIEDWKQLTGQDLETALFRIQQLRFTVAPQMNELLMEAMFAKHIHDDVSSDAYSSVIDGTIGDRNAKANKVARQDKYAAFYRYWLYSQGEALMKELDRFEWLLKNVRSWQVRSQES